jgi:hypothetical protein|eukprot:scaffold16144_cov97-Skeletonema_marinoi.AAC.1
MVSFPYHGGVYEGHIILVKKRPNGKKKARAQKYKMIPHGRGIYKFNGMVFNGIFRDGFEDVGRLTWPDGTSFVGKFNAGYPEPKVLQSLHENCLLKKRIKELQSKLIFKQAEHDDSKVDLDIEKETTMAVALTLDRCQTKLARVFELASVRNCITAAEIHHICSD